MTPYAETTSLVVFVPGRPAPQGSHKYVGHRGGKPILTESSRHLAAWRDTVAWRVRAAAGPITLAPPVHAYCEFVMPRPKNMPSTRETPPMVRRPDGDKLLRGVLDALTFSRVITDDSHVTRIELHKRYAEPGQQPGVHISLTEGTD